MGNPMDPTPEAVIEKLVEVAKDPKSHRYPETSGIPHLKIEIADHYGIPLRPLKITLERFSEYVDQAMDKEFGKPILSGAQPLIYPPYYCIRLWPKVHHTMGGVLINFQAQVLDLSRQPIKDFYAAGEVTDGIHGACRLSSCAIIDCLVFGRIAGRNAAEQGAQS